MWTTPKRSAIPFKGGWVVLVKNKGLELHLMGTQYQAGLFFHTISLF